jgi:hypothetical protein
MGISVHTGWGACVVVGGSLARPEIVSNDVIDILGDSERFCFHMAAEMKRAAAASHPRIHTAEGCFYRDVLRDACTIPVRVVPPASLDPSKVGKLAAPPWGRDQKLAALAAWAVMPG